MRRLVRRTLWIGFAVLTVGVLVFLPKIWGDLVYPLRYQELITQSATEFNLPPSLIAGVIYTESHFNPQATSGVGARGLMQIMPATGGGIANILGDTNYSADKLYDPATNIRYGSFYLRNLHDRYNQNLDAVLAGYNGGPGVANRFLESGTSSIPLETAGFIGKVKRARDAYFNLYGPELGQNIGERLFDREEKTLWDQIFGWLFPS